ncbi:hypothetical protein TELCIR_09536 [Teladorsagia circumcincta]|uniref:Immunoglobulin I-set domain-containing protein n=1 Tax=Teladorsagia circumcincta TaxID=45464 RepID=A0A2G9UEQ3_TELCI|nr:hypothetical protein TELCIR_09536 [Teladorsagia circumcincta]
MTEADSSIPEKSANFRAKIEHDPQTGIVSLTISQMFNDDVGEYTCRASNIHGEIFFHSGVYDSIILEENKL